MGKSRPRLTGAQRRQRRKKRAFKEAGGACHYCGVSIKLKEATVDHKVPRSRGGRNNKENLVCSCGGCNALKGAHDYSFFLWAISGDNPLFLLRASRS